MSLRTLAARARRRLIRPELAPLLRQLDTQREEQQRLRVALGQLMTHTVVGTASSVDGAEFSAFSQFGEDGIIEYLVQHCDIAPSSFVEIGVESYDEANTRFLAEHRLWRGMIIDQNPNLVHDLAQTNLNWKAQVTAVSTFVTRENIRSIVDAACTGGLGLLSVDIDGVDYWILEQLVDLTPALIIVEYNSLFGATATVSVPYDAEFDRRRPEYHSVYYGASLGAFAHLLGRHGYSLVGCTAAGNNAFFVRSDRLGDVPGREVAVAFRPRRFVEHRANGALTGITDRERQLHDVEHLPLVDVSDGRFLMVGEVLT